MISAWALKNRCQFFGTYLIYLIYLTPEIHSLTYKNTSLCTLADYHM